MSRWLNPSFLTDMLRSEPDERDSGRVRGTGSRAPRFEGLGSPERRPAKAFSVSMPSASKLEQLIESFRAGATLVEHQHVHQCL